MQPPAPRVPSFGPDRSNDGPAGLQNRRIALAGFGLRVKRKRSQGHLVVLWWVVLLAFGWAAER
jgi:hypothetical protein